MQTKGKWRVFSGRLNAVVETEPFVMKTAVKGWPEVGYDGKG